VENIIKELSFPLFTTVVSNIPYLNSFLTKSNKFGIGFNAGITTAQLILPEC
jgi:hypothetical protein